jgi:hypothetical protein
MPKCQSFCFILFYFIFGQQIDWHVWHVWFQRSSAFARANMRTVTVGSVMFRVPIAYTPSTLHHTRTPIR